MLVPTCRDRLLLVGAFEQKTCRFCQMRLQNYNFFLIYTNFRVFFLRISEKKRNFAPDFKRRLVNEGKIPDLKGYTIRRKPL